MGAKAALFLPLDYLRFVENMASKYYYAIADATVYLDTRSPGILPLEDLPCMEDQCAHSTTADL